MGTVYKNYGTVFEKGSGNKEWKVTPRIDSFRRDIMQR